MQHAIFAGEGMIRLADSPEPLAAETEAILEVGACALCGSDLRPWKRGWPVTPGHEIAGTVRKPGHALNGRRALVYIPVWCGRCPACLDGDAHLCENGTDLMGWQRPGGYAQRLAVPLQCLLPVPDDVPTELAPLLLDTIGTAAHGLRMAQRIVKPGSALVMGAGPIGLGAIMVLRQMGYAPVHVVEPGAHRRGVAESLGAVAVDPSAIARRYGMVVEASGKDAARQLALECVDRHGVVLQLGEADSWQVTETKAIRRKDFVYLRSFYFPISEYEENLALLRSGIDDYRRFVDAVVPLDGLPSLFEEFAAGLRIKPIVRFPDLAL